VIPFISDFAVQQESTPHSVGNDHFRARARHDAARLQVLVELLSTGLPSLTLASIGTLAHRLHGAATLHGVPSVTNAAIRLERLALELHDAEEDPLPGQYLAVSGAARRLCATIERMED
jgi:HPt (histidine-containing phosphotransfer) domain-containing protein